MANYIKTPLNGITTTSGYEEGDMLSLVNLRPMNGSLHPVAPRKVIKELNKSYDIVFLHQMAGYQNWIGTSFDGRYSSISYKVDTETPEPIENYIIGKINSIQQVGHTLSVITEEETFYLIYQEDKYIFLGNLPELPVISWGVKSKTSLMKYFVNEYGSGTVKINNFLDATKGLVNKAMNEINEDKGMQLFDAHLVRYAFRLFDGSLTKPSPPILLMPHDNILSTKRMAYGSRAEALNDDSWVFVSGYKAAMSYEIPSYRDWKDIIQSVDIFMSPPLGVSNIENIRTDMDTSDDGKWREYNLIKDISLDSMKSVREESNFYFIRSLSLGSSASILNPDEFPTLNSDISNLQNLIYQEPMTDDGFSHHSYGSKASYSYNGRLHLGDLKTTFFKGHNLGYTQWWNKYNGTIDPNESSSSTGKYDGIIAEVEIQTGMKIGKVHSIYAIYLLKTSLFSSSYISYPDPRAKRMTFYGIENNKWVRIFSVDLQPHRFLNLAFFVNEKLNPIQGINPTTVPSLTIGEPIQIEEPNKIRVSELSNPMSFPNKNVYQIGNGSILAMASNATKISEGQFGQFPLYVFTTQGVYSLNVGEGEVAYSNVSAPTSYEIPISKLVASTPFGVVFTSARGICIIRGQEVDLLTLNLHESPKDLNVEFLPPMEEKVHNFTTPLKQFLQQLDNIIYDPYENELIMSDRESKFNYILNLYSSSFYQSTERIDLVVSNTYPYLYVIEENRVKDFEFAEVDSDGKPARIDVSFITRPLQFGMPYIKWLEKVQLFCTLYDAHPLLYISHSSSNGVNFKGMSGMNLPERANYTTLETQIIAGNKFRYFLFCFGATIDPKSTIDYLNSWVGAEYKNNLMK